MFCPQTKLNVSCVTLQSFSNRCPQLSLCVSVLQEKQSEVEGVKQQLVEVEEQRDEHSDTIGKLKQVTAETETPDNTHSPGLLKLFQPF